MRVDVAAVGAEGDKEVGMFEPQVPGSRGAHRHAAQNDPIPIDVVPSADRLDGLEHVGFAGPTVAILDAAQGMQFDERLLAERRRRACRLFKAIYETKLAQPYGRVLPCNTTSNRMRRCGS